MSNRLWYAWHSWLGVMTGLMLFVICWTGSFATISNELDALLNPDIRASAAETLDLAAAYGAAATAFPNATVRFMDPPLYRGLAVDVVIETQAEQWRHVYVDPVSNEILGTTSYFNVQRFFRSFHMGLFGLLGVGLFFVSAFGLVVLASLTSSLFFYKRWWRRFFALKTDKGAKAFWSSLHKTAGLWSVWFLLAIGVTGAWYLFEHGRARLGDGINTYYGSGDYAENQLPDPKAGDGATLSFHDLLTRAQAERPDIKKPSVAPDSRGFFYISGQAGHFLVRDRANQLLLNAADGSVVYNQHAPDLPPYWRWSDTADPIHFGNFAGLTSKLVYFAFGVGLSGLCLTGVWLHVKRLERDRKGRAAWPGALVAVALTYAVLIGTLFAGGAEIKGWGPVVDGVRRWPAVPIGVTAFLVFWTLTTLAIIAVFTAVLARALLKDREAPSIFKAYRRFIGHRLTKC